MKKSYIAPECTNVQMPESFCQLAFQIEGSARPRTNQQF